MKTLVLGGGVVGVTTAYFLAKAGHEVTVVEEKDALGLEATAGNAGIIAPGHSFAWASPRAPRMLWQSLRGGETPSAYGWRPTCASTRGASASCASVRRSGPAGTRWSSCGSASTARRS